MINREEPSHGQLYVFEGPDEVGKTTVTREVEEKLMSAGYSCCRVAFPGKKEGSLGKLVYQLHHNPESFGLSSHHPLALQILHIAAHVEAIDRRIRPALQKYRVVLLDRYWWSTWVYGRASGISATLLRKALSVEKEVWRGLLPSILFLLIEGPNSAHEPSNRKTVRNYYHRIAAHEAGAYPISRVINTPPLATTVDSIASQIHRTLDHST